MKKDDCERAIKYLCSTYAKENNVLKDGSGDPSFSDFHMWLSNNYPQYLTFQARGGVSYWVEHWWAQEFKQTWRY